MVVALHHGLYHLLCILRLHGALSAEGVFNPIDIVAVEENIDQRDGSAAIKSDVMGVSPRSERGDFHTGIDWVISRLVTLRNRSANKNS